MSIALEKIKSKISEDEETLEKLKDEGASLETKKMIACRLFSRFEVGQRVQDQGHNEYDLSAVRQRLGRGTDDGGINNPVWTFGFHTGF